MSAPTLGAAEILDALFKQGWDVELEKAEEEVGWNLLLSKSQGWGPSRRSPGGQEWLVLQFTDSDLLELLRRAHQELVAEAPEDSRLGLRSAAKSLLADVADGGVDLSEASPELPVPVPASKLVALERALPSRRVS